MHLKRVAHAVGHRTRINPAAVAAQAVGVPEAVRNKPATFLACGVTNLRPGGLAIQVSPERITGTVAAAKRRELDLPCLPTIQKLPVAQALHAIEGQWERRAAVSPPPDRFW